MNKQQSKEPITYPINTNITLMVTCSWHLSVASLWPNCAIPYGDQLAAQSLLRKFMLRATDPYKCYLEICQRVLLTREKMLEDPGFGISNMPCRFFNSTEKGFALSELWYRELLQRRKKELTYKLDLRGLAEAVLEMGEEPTTANFNYWRCWFAEQLSFDAQLLFVVFSAFYIFKAGSNE